MLDNQKPPTNEIKNKFIVNTSFLTPKVENKHKDYSPFKASKTLESFNNTSGMITTTLPNSNNKIKDQIQGLLYPKL